MVWYYTHPKHGGQATAFYVIPNQNSMLLGNQSGTVLPVPYYCGQDDRKKERHTYGPGQGSSLSDVWRDELKRSRPRTVALAVDYGTDHAHLGRSIAAADIDVIRAAIIRRRLNINGSQRHDAMASWRGYANLIVLDRISTSRVWLHHEQVFVETPYVS